MRGLSTDEEARRPGQLSRLNHPSVPIPVSEHLVGDGDPLGNRPRPRPSLGQAMSRFLYISATFGPGCMCPGQNESPTGQARGLKAHGKRKSSRLRKGAPWLKTMLVQCAWAASRKKDSYDKAQFNRLRSKRGPKKAICAVAASMLTAIYHMLKDGTFHRDLGADHFDRLRFDRGQSQAPCRAAHQARLPGRASTPRRSGMMSLPTVNHRSWPNRRIYAPPDGGPGRGGRLDPLVSC